MCSDNFVNGKIKWKNLWDEKSKHFELIMVVNLHQMNLKIT